MKTTSKFDQEFHVSFWNIKTAREIISDEVDKCMYENPDVQIHVREENFIVYVLFLISITCKSTKEGKEIAKKIERRLTDNEKGSTV